MRSLVLLDPQGQGAFRSTFPLWCVNVPVGSDAGECRILC